MGAPERKFFAETLKGVARGLASGAAESKLPEPFVNFVAKLCESGEGLIDDVLLTPIMKRKFDEKMNQKAETIPRPKDESEMPALPEPKKENPEQEGAFQW